MKGAAGRAVVRAPASTLETLSFGTVTVTHPDRLPSPDDGLTRANLALRAGTSAFARPQKLARTSAEAQRLWTREGA